MDKEKHLLEILKTHQNNFETITKVFDRAIERIRRLEDENEKLKKSLRSYNPYFLDKF